MADKYNGWTNYETWCVNLWLTNDEGSYNGWTEQAQTAFDGATDRGIGISRTEQAMIDLADCLKDEITEQAPELEASMYSDLLNAALSEVNWYEIAGAFMEIIERRNS